LAVNGQTHKARFYQRGALLSPPNPDAFAVPASIQKLGIHVQGSWIYLDDTVKMLGVAVWDSALGPQDHQQLQAAANGAYPGFALGMYNRAAALPGGVSWEQRWQRARDEMDGLRAHVLQQGARIRDCANPIGIADEDLPLYFGDTTGPINAFFASSTYLASQWA